MGPCGMILNMKAVLDYRSRMRLTLDLYEAAEAIMRQNLRRRHPEADDAEICP